MMKLSTIYLFALALLLISACGKSLSFEENGTLVPLTVVDDSSLPSIKINGVLLHSETYGNPSDPMLVLIHGGPGADYRGLLNFKELANDSFFVVFYDQRGCGLSERIDRSSYSSIQTYIDELDGVINHYRNSATQEVVLAGHSWGAMLATAYVNQKPDSVLGMILAEPGGFTWEQTISYVEKARKLELFAETTNDYVYQDQIITGDDHNTLDYKMALSTAGDVTTGDLGATPFWRYGAICNIASLDLAINNPEQLDFTANLSLFTRKTLFAFSELNTAYGREHADAVSAFLPNVELAEILDCGHEIPHFGWNNFYAVVKNYLTEIL